MTLDSDIKDLEGEFDELRTAKINVKPELSRSQLRKVKKYTSQVADFEWEFNQIQRDYDAGWRTYDTLYLAEFQIKLMDIDEDIAKLKKRIPSDNPVYQKLGSLSRRLSVVERKGDVILDTEDAEDEITNSIDTTVQIPTTNFEPNFSIPATPSYQREPRFNSGLKWGLTRFLLFGAGGGYGAYHWHDWVSETSKYGSAGSLDQGETTIIFGCLAGIFGIMLPSLLEEVDFSGFYRTAANVGRHVLYGTLGTTIGGFFGGFFGGIIGNAISTDMYLDGLYYGTAAGALCGLVMGITNAREH
ncbi:hypothetical protein HQ533_03725 [Candidatus Woesearchaeota archaeon]|nr:hypothetical protein [Candidatus Woesearchaeota archaeon]